MLYSILSITTLLYYNADILIIENIIYYKRSMMRNKYLRRYKFIDKYKRM